METTCHVVAGALLVGAIGAYAQTAQADGRGDARHLHHINVEIGA